MKHASGSQRRPTCSPRRHEMALMSIARLDDDVNELRRVYDWHML
jgi:hypothetical protein